MATTANDNLFNVSQSFFSPDILQKISTEINQPLEKTKAGLKSVIPTLLMGIINKGSTKEGAESLVTMASTQVLPVDTEGEGGTTTTVKEGTEFLNGIFGNNLSNVVSKLGMTTGMNTGSISKMLGMAAPLVMGAVGSKIRNEKMSASGLMSFLGQQKSSLMALIPTGIPGMSSLQKVTEEKTIWPKIVLAALLIGAFIWWFNAYKYPSPKTAAVTQTTEAPLPIEATQFVVPKISALQDFMSSNATNGTLKRFRFESLNFGTGTAALMKGADVELNQIATAMKAYPNSTAKIEGFTDNTGSPTTNQNLSSSRAMAVKKELLARGIKADRIQVAGMGATNPISTNNTTEGRAENRRIEFVIKK